MNSNSGMIPQMIRNEDNLYDGNLKKYFSIVFMNAQNLFNPYHNFRHMLHVSWLCYQACSYYKGKLSPREMRNLLIAALFHDYDHCGIMGNDDLNITRAIRGMEKNLLPEDRCYLNEIVAVIKATEYPYTDAITKPSLLQQIIRDADMGQSLSVAWIQHVIFGLASEWNKKPIDVLRMQLPFHRNLKFDTEWGRLTFPQDMIDEKIREVNELIDILAETSV